MSKTNSGYQIILKDKSIPSNKIVVFSGDSKQKLVKLAKDYVSGTNRPLEVVNSNWDLTLGCLYETSQYSLELVEVSSSS